MIGTPTGVCLPGRLESITLGHGTPTVEMCPEPIPRGAEGRDEHARHWTVRPPVAQSSCRGGGRGVPPPAVVASLEWDGEHGGGGE